jgi:hypothetical protein
MNDSDVSPHPLAWERELHSRFAGLHYEPVKIKDLFLPELFYNRPPAPPSLESHHSVLPLFVCRRAKGTYTIIDGCARFLFFKDQDIDECMCGIFPSSLSDLKVALFRILLNRNRPLHLREEYGFLQLCKKFIPGADNMMIGQWIGWDRKKTMELEELQEHGHIVQDAVTNGIIHLENASDFNRLPEPDQSSFISFFKGLQLSLQAEREFLQWLPEIAYSRKQSIASVLGSKDITGITTAATHNPPQKIMKIRAYLFGLRFPQYDKTLRDWKLLIKKTFGAQSNISIEPCPYFEKNRLEFRMRLTMAHEAQKVFEKLAAITEQTWSSLISPTQ